ncbi:hypothetical protein DSECCO2_407900 [anaerobic digester metagenome]
MGAGYVQVTQRGQSSSISDRLRREPSFLELQLCWCGRAVDNPCPTSRDRSGSRAHFVAGFAPGCSLHSIPLFPTRYQGKNSIGNR